MKKPLRRTQPTHSPGTGLVLALALVWLARPASAETKRPLVTEDVNTLDDGEIEVQVGFDGVTDFTSPSGALKGPLVRGPIVGLNAGFGNRAEVQLRAPLNQRFHPEGASARRASGDVTIATKVRFFGGRGVVPGFGARALVKLPNVSETTGIGTDETDVTLELLAGVDLAGASVMLSAGYAILGDPSTLASQNDKLVLGAGFFLPLGLFDLGADLHGIVWGDHAAPDEWSAIGGLARKLGPVRVDGGAGILSHGGSRSFLVTGGLTTSFHLKPAR